MAEPFESVVRNPLDYSFDSAGNGAFAQQIVKEIEGHSNILLDATYMATSEDSRHRGKRDTEELRKTSVTVASDEGDVFSDSGHTSEYETEIGSIADGCKYNSIQERNAHDSDVATLKRIDISNKIAGLNDHDAFLTVYGNSANVDDSWANVDPKGWNGFAYYTRKLSDFGAFRDSFYARKNPFVDTGLKDLCLSIDNHRTTDSSAYTAEKFSSIYAVVWGADAVSKLFPKNSNSLGINTTIYEPQTVQYAPRDNTNAIRLYKEGYITFRKDSGVNVHDRFGLIRLANIQFDESSESQMKDEYKRLVENLSFMVNVIRMKGWANRVKWYCPLALIDQIRIARYLDGQANVVYIDSQLNEIGQRHGLTGDRVKIMDGCELTGELQMSNLEKEITLTGNAS